MTNLQCHLRLKYVAEYYLETVSKDEIKSRIPEDAEKVDADSHSDSSSEDEVDKVRPTRQFP